MMPNVQLDFSKSPALVARKKVSKLNKPNALEWSVEEVSRWLLALGLHPFYVHRLAATNLTGKDLLRLDQADLLKVGIVNKNLRDQLLRAVPDLIWPRPERPSETGICYQSSPQTSPLLAPIVPIENPDEEVVGISSDSDTSGSIMRVEITPPLEGEKPSLERGLSFVAFPESPDEEETDGASKGEVEEEVVRPRWSNARTSSSTWSGGMDPWDVDNEEPPSDVECELDSPRRYIPTPRLAQYRGSFCFGLAMEKDRRVTMAKPPYGRRSGLVEVEVPKVEAATPPSEEVKQPVQHPLQNQRVQNLPREEPRRLQPVRRRSSRSPKTPPPTPQDEDHRQSAAAFSARAHARLQESAAALRRRAHQHYVAAAQPTQQHHRQPEAAAARAVPVPALHQYNSSSSSHHSSGSHQPPTAAAAPQATSHAHLDHRHRPNARLHQTTYPTHQYVHDLRSAAAPSAAQAVPAQWYLVAFPSGQQFVADAGQVAQYYQAAAHANQTAAQANQPAATTASSTGHHAAQHQAAAYYATASAYPTAVPTLQQQATTRNALAGVPAAAYYPQQPSTVAAQQTPIQYQHPCHVASSSASMDDVMPQDPIPAPTHNQPIAAGLNEGVSSPAEVVQPLLTQLESVAEAPLEEAMCAAEEAAMCVAAAQHEEVMAVEEKQGVVAEREFEEEEDMDVEVIPPVADTEVAATAVKQLPKLVKVNSSEFPRLRKPQVPAEKKGPSPAPSTTSRTSSEEIWDNLCNSKPTSALVTPPAATTDKQQKQTGCTTTKKRAKTLLKTLPPVGKCPRFSQTRCPAGPSFEECEEDPWN